jgi:ABC-type iron transport system FetAB permease component
MTQPIFDQILIGVIPMNLLKYIFKLDAPAAVLLAAGCVLFALAAAINRLITGQRVSIWDRVVASVFFSVVLLIITRLPMPGLHPVRGLRAQHGGRGRQGPGRQVLAGSECRQGWRAA